MRAEDASGASGGAGGFPREGGLERRHGDVLVFVQAFGLREID
jgi:hypothetical protein